MSVETRQMCRSISVHVSSNVFELEGDEGLLYSYLLNHDIDLYFILF